LVPSFVDVVRLLPLFVLMCSTMLSVEAPDFDSDARSGKSNAVVRLGVRRTSLAYPALAAAALAGLALFCLVGWASPWALLVALIVVPLSALETKRLREAARSGKAVAGASAGAAAFALFCLATAASFLLR
jgi:1,4-dihydroxy-2-naphthoate octaprenyltransferase